MDTDDLAKRFSRPVADAITAGTARAPFPKLLGFRVDSAEPGRTVCSLPLRPELGSGVGLVHGGAISALIDHTLSLTVYPLVEPGKWVATQEFKVNYLDSVKEGTLVATGTLLSIRRVLAVVRVDVTCGDRPIAAAQGTLYIRDPAK